MQEFLISYVNNNSVAGALLLMSVVVAVGLALGSLQVSGVGLGIAGVLFSGLLFAHFGFTLDPHIMEFAREFGLILFVYTIGLQVGPGFFASLRQRGLALNLMAGSIVLLGALITTGLIYFRVLDTAVAVGLLSGATTNTPSLAAASAALNETAGITAEALKLPGMGYAMAYPFGILGILLTMLLIRLFFRVKIQEETAQLKAQDASEGRHLENFTIEITNQNLDQMKLSELTLLSSYGIVISRLMSGGKIEVARPDSVLHVGDIAYGVAPLKNMGQARLLMGKPSGVKIKELSTDIMTQRIVVTHGKVLGKRLDELQSVQTKEVVITRISRADIEFTPEAGLRLQRGDTLIAVGDHDAVQALSHELGNSARHLNHPQLIPVFLGIALGILIGIHPIPLPGVPMPVKLGLAGGPLIAAILLSRLGAWGPLSWYMPISANFMLREVGIVLFLACVGIKSGGTFVHTLVSGPGLFWMACGATITLVPLLIVGFIARGVYKLNYLSLCGLLAGSMTDPPALAFANTLAPSEAASVSYATVYPLVMLLRVLSAQAIVIFMGVL